MTLAPHPYDVEVGDGHGYMLDRKRQGDWRHETIPLLRPAFITQDTLGEKSLNPESLWRFSDRDWSHGAGQRRADMPDSDTSRFWQSMGVDVWTKWQVSLLPDFTQVTPGSTVPDSVGSALKTQIHVYVAGTTPTQNGILFANNPSSTSWSLITGSASGQGLAFDGANVYYGAAGGLSSAAEGSTTGSTYNSSWTPTANLSFALGRLLDTADSGTSIKNIVGTGAGDIEDVGTVPTGWEVTPSSHFVGGQQAIYFVAQRLDGLYTQIYKIGISDDGTSLDPPVAVTPPIPGVPNDIFVYANFLFLGMLTGWRACTIEGDGSLTVGPIVETGNCQGFTARGRFVYFAWTSINGSTCSGVGRIDPTVVHDDGSMAYASDVCAVGASGHPLVTSQSVGSLAVFGSGVWVESPTDLVDRGYIDSGLVSYDLPDDKTAHYLTVRTDSSSTGPITPSIALNGSSTFTDLDTVDAGVLSQRDPIDVAAAGFFEIRETLERDPDDATQGAVLTRHMLEAEPIVASGSYLYVPLLLTDPVDASDGQPKKVDVNAELTYLEGLRDAGTTVTYRELGNSYQVTVEEITWLPTHPTVDRSGAQATCLLKLKTV